MKSVLWTTLLFALSALPLPAQASPAAPQGRGLRVERMARALNLTEAQASSIKAIREKRKADLMAHRDNLRQARIAFRSAQQQANTPEAQLRSLHDKASAAQFEMMLARRSMHQEVLTVLTPEQRVKATELQARAKARRLERMHHLRQAAGMAG